MTRSGITEQMRSAEQAKDAEPLPTMSREDLEALFELRDTLLAVWRGPVLERQNLESALPYVRLLNALVNAVVRFGDNLQRAEIPDGFFDALSQDERQTMFCWVLKMVTDAIQGTAR